MLEKYLIILLLIISFHVQGNSLHFEPNPAGKGYVVTGMVDANMLIIRKGSTWGKFYVNVHETGRDYYEYTDEITYCPKDATGAAKFMNERLSKRVLASTYVSYADSGDYWTAKVYCESSATEFWMTSTTLPSPPASARCDIKYPSTVSFGNVVLGEKKAFDANINITCDKSADITVSLSKEIIDLDDARVTYAFPGGKPSYQAAVIDNSPTNFDVRFSLEDTGKTVGYKSGSAIMLFQWQ